MLVATAGHVDHGKTSLVKHLTGVDTDRLEEEKRRGLTIDLGFAYARVNDETTIGFIDVPGHSRFINTMIAGVGSIDLGMLVVAADDGPMPQTHEHIQVMRLLGVSRFIVVISKIDRVEAQRVDQLIAQMSAMLPECESFFPLSNTAETGVLELQSWLKQQALNFQSKAVSGHFRLAVDRCFSMKGTGLVVTGTAIAGQVEVGDELEILPGRERARVRSLRVQNCEASRGRAGERCALNLVGVSDVAKGSWLAAADCFHRSHRVDAQFEMLATAPFPLKHLSPVRLYMGARRVAAKLYFLEKPEQGRLVAGASALVQLILSEPISCCTGDRFLIRDDSETVTLGGGEILDPIAPKLGKARQHRLDFLSAMTLPGTMEKLEALLGHQSPPLDILSLANSCNVPLQEIDKLLASSPVQRFEVDAVKYAVAAHTWNENRALLQSLVVTWHGQNPQGKGITVQALKELFIEAASSESSSLLFKPIVGGLVQDNSLALRGGLVIVPGHKQILSDEQQSNWDKLSKVLLSEGIMIPAVSDLATAAGLDPNQAHQTLASAARLKLVWQISDSRYALAQHLRKHAEIVAQLAQTPEGLTIISYKNKIGSGRKLAIEVLEYFDSVRYTQRRGDCRVILDVAVPEQRFAG